VKASSLTARMSESKSRWLLPERRDSLGSVEACSLRCGMADNNGFNKRYRRIGGSLVVWERLPKVWSAVFTL